MGMKRQDNAGVFENQPEYFQNFTGSLVDAEQIKDMDFDQLHVAVIGLNQSLVTQLDRICQQASSVKVFQIEPLFILPSTNRTLQRLLNHPLISKNKNLVSHRIKGLVSLRFLENQVENLWLRRQLMPNFASANRIFLKSDSFYQALQRENCQLLTWPILKINEKFIYCINDEKHTVDVIIRTS